MADPYVREVGRIANDDDEGELIIGVAYDTVTIAETGMYAGGIHLGPQLQEEFAQLFATACWQAGQQDGRVAADGMP